MKIEEHLMTMNGESRERNPKCEANGIRLELGCDLKEEHLERVCFKDDQETSDTPAVR
jgi:hypothetical protein